METSSHPKTAIRFDNPAVQKDGSIKRIIGFVRAKDMISLFNDTTLDANPRSAKVNHVTSDIIRSVHESPSVFQFMTKGILLGTSSYRSLERNRFELTFQDPVYEGLLDGGHNMLAIGTYLLSEVLSDKEIRKIKLWKDFKNVWNAHKEQVKDIRNKFEFKVPVELLVPSNTKDEDVVQKFTMALIDICAARNNNAQLTTEAKANQRGFYEEIRKRMPPDLENRVEWKTNQWELDETRPIKVRNLIALAWIPLIVLHENKLLPTRSESGSNINFNVPPQKIYSSKGELSKLFDRLMEHPAISKPANGPRYELHNPEIGSAFDILKILPELYDKVFLDFPEAYNSTEGSRFGAIKAVKYNNGKKLYSSPFYNTESAYGVPDGYVLPFVFGLKALIRLNNRKLEWIEEPRHFLDCHMVKLVESFRMPMTMANYDPQKVAKQEASYRFMFQNVEMNIRQKF